ncbi:uncharacterized protein VTP21DRAFT_2573 [Calcarisporiella thermophila]|uniref:uncharacterized protein n=1 Tax=Calcarisporiella thermophila TaxID=911321 RepID=UPI003742C5BA
MGFIVGLPKTRSGYDSIVVFVDRLTKRAHFVPTKSTVTAPEVARLFFDIVFRLHGLPRVIVSDRDSMFTSSFWQELFTWAIYLNKKFFGHFFPMSHNLRNTPFT